MKILDNKIKERKARPTTVQLFSIFYKVFGSELHPTDPDPILLGYKTEPEYIELNWLPLFNKDDYLDYE